MCKRRRRGGEPGYHARVFAIGPWDQCRGDQCQPFGFDEAFVWLVAVVVLIWTAIKLARAPLGEGDDQRILRKLGLFLVFVYWSGFDRQHIIGVDDLMLLVPMAVVATIAVIRRRKSGLRDGDVPARPPQRR
jgi:hypothetical protein